MSGSDGRPEVGTLGAVATLLGVTRNRAKQIVEIKSFPAPLPGPPGGVKVWSIAEVREWAIGRGRTVYDPPKDKAP